MSDSTTALERSPVVHYDHHSADFAERHEEIARDMLANTPVAWSEAYGGFWQVSRYDDSKYILENWQLFSSENRIPEGDYSRRGAAIPPIGILLPLNECDPPVHTRLRMIEAPFFTPKYLGRWKEMNARLTTQVIDHVIESGHCDLHHDICVRIPIMTALHVGGADPNDWKFFANPDAFHGGGDHDLGVVNDKLLAIIEDRRVNPREDMATAMANARVDGEPLATEVAVDMLHIILTGAFDTATSVLCDSFEWLEANPARRDELIADPALVDTAADEFLRMWPPVSNMARNVTQDVELRGCRLRAGDWVQVSAYAANHDPEKFPDPFEIRFDRANAREHLAYSGGVHRCLGAPLARLELQHIIREVLRRLPDYNIDRARARRRPGMGLVKGWETIPITFTPGRREGG